MNSLRFALTVILMSFSTAALAQLEHVSATASVPSEAQKAFEMLKTLAGTWEGTLTTVPPMEEMAGTRVKVMIRVTSRGNAIMHEMTIDGIPDNPISMLYLDGEHLMLTHYCDIGNRPRMAGKLSPDGKIIEFEVLDISGSTERGHMSDTVFTIVDATHHIEEWTSNYPGGKLTGRFHLQRTKGASGPFGQ